MKRNCSSRIFTCTFNSISIVLFLLGFWVCNTKAPCLFFFDSWKTIFLSIFNLIFWVFFFLFEISYFVFDKTIFDIKKSGSFDSFSGQNLLFLLLMLVCVQGVFDIVQWGLVAGIKEQSFFISLPFIFIKWGIFLLLFQKARPMQIKKKKIFWIFVIIGSLFLVVPAFSVGTDYFAEFLSFREKLDPNELTSARLFDNFNFKTNVLLLITEGTAAIFFSIIHAFFLTETVLLKKTISLVVLPVRISLISLLCILFSAIKFFTFPFFSFSDFSGFKQETVFFSENSSFDVLSSQKIFSRKMGYSLVQPFYHQNEYAIYYNEEGKGKFVKKFSSLYDFSSLNDESYRKFLFGETTVEVFKNFAICFDSQQGPMVILYDEIAQYEKNQILISTCKNLIEEGNVVVFDYAADYLLQYDPSFLKVYVDRYKQGDFSAEEKAYIHSYGYREEYLISRAKQIVNSIIQSGEGSVIDS